MKQFEIRLENGKYIIWDILERIPLAEIKSENNRENIRIKPIERRFDGKKLAYFDISKDFGEILISY